jgi:threonine aldolase
MIDLRSDTCSRPTREMREAMAAAAVGDDVYGEDPTVKELEATVAALLGKEDAVYMATGTMTNQVAIRTHTRAGDAILVDQHAHLYRIEGGTPAAYSGVLPIGLPGIRGVFAPDDVRAAVGVGHRFMPSTVMPPVTLLCLENTHNAGGGKIWPLDRLEAVAAAGRELGLKLHLDGARIWNATAASGVPECAYAAPFDSVSVCFSKGLGAPVGSALASSREFVACARRFKQQIGGGFRQAGIIAAGALYALNNNRARLREDHVHARRLAGGLAQLPGIELDVATVETNIVRFRVSAMAAGDFAERCYDKGLYVLPSGIDGIRAIPYLNVTTDQIDRAVSIIAAVLAESRVPA